MKGARIVYLLVVVLAVWVLVSGCITPPKENQGSLSQGKGKLGTSAPTAAPTQVVIDTRVVTPATPFPTPTTSTIPKSFTNLPEPTIEPTVYKVVYCSVMPFSNNATAYSVTVKTPRFSSRCASLRRWSRGTSGTKAGSRQGKTST